MAATSSSRPVYVQQSFLWDLPESSEATCELPAIGPLNKKVVHDDSNRTVRPSSRNPVSAPQYGSSSSARRGRCEHVGSILASVLEKYGIGIDQLIAEIDAK